MKFEFYKKKSVSKFSRRVFSDANIIFPSNSLLSVQKESYSSFVGSIESEGKLSESLRRFFPIRNTSKTVELDYINYRIGEPRLSSEEARLKESTYSAPIFAKFKIVAQLDGKEHVREQEMYMGEMPLMTDAASFIVNGVERVVVSQIHRSPGVIFGHDSGKTHSSGKKLFNVKIIPYRGSWLDFEFDYRDILHSRIDKKRKVYATTMLLALNGQLKRSDLEVVGFSQEKIDSICFSGNSLKNKKRNDDKIDVDRSKILQFFYKVKRFSIEMNGLTCDSNFESLINCYLDFDLINMDNLNVIFHRNTQISDLFIKKISDQFESIRLSDEFLINSYIASDVFDPVTGELLFSVGDIISEGILNVLRSKSVSFIDTVLSYEFRSSPYILDTLIVDKNLNSIDALSDIYKAMRPGDNPSVESSKSFFASLFFDSAKYDLSMVGRSKINERLKTDIDEFCLHLTPADILASVIKLINIKKGNDTVDDIDSLSCRRIRSVGELFEGQCYSSFAKVERTMLDLINSADPEVVMPSDIVSVRFLDVPLRDSILLNQLSQFMDQTNPLSEISHKRRISALGPGALSRDKSSINFDVRDVHPTQYGKICPIETPEGANLGIVSSLSIYSSINKYGFLETPYYEVKDKKLSSDFKYYSTSGENSHKIAQFTDVIDGQIKNSDSLVVRINGDYCSVSSDDITLCDVSPAQPFSAATVLIPFVEQDDSHRALMGANMQRQAVPLVDSEEPLVGTGWEGYIAKGSGSVMVAKASGKVIKVDGSMIAINRDDGFTIDVYHLRKFSRSNSGTCINQRPVIYVGDYVNKGDVISDGPCIKNGEIALGRNVTVAFLPYFGKNFEDSVVISVNAAKYFSSVHLIEESCRVTDGKGIFEDITRSIPNVSAEQLRHLNEFGLPYIGSKVSAGDILVGKVSRNSFEHRMSPEDKLLRSVFGDIALNVKDVSLRVPIGVKDATVIDVQVSVKRGSEKDSFVKFIEKSRIQKLIEELNFRKEFLLNGIKNSLIDYLILNKSIFSFNKKDIDNDIDVDNFINSISSVDIFNISSRDSECKLKIDKLLKFYRSSLSDLDFKFEEQKSDILRGDDLSSGVLKSIKVILAVDRPLRAGDKMAGRHGNKGVVSCILPTEDMPFMEDGTPIDVVLTPVGVPSRMNIGQISETILGWGLHKLGSIITDMLCEISNQDVCDVSDLRKFLISIYSRNIIQGGNFVKNFDIDGMSDEDLVSFASNLSDGVHVASSIFDGASRADIDEILKIAELPESGKYDLYDGRTGEKFDRKVTVGKMHYLKLHHLVEDKIHARSVGPYSLVTQQPLGGKAQFGGQRFGEMEVWAIEAYGAACTLQEMMTVKSDDKEGRIRQYSNIVEDGNVQSNLSSVPSSFQVLVQEKRALGIDVRLEISDGTKSFRKFNAMLPDIPESGEEVEDFYDEVEVIDEIQPMPSLIEVV